VSIETVKVSLEERLQLNRAIAVRWALGFAIAACVWTVLMLGLAYAWTEASDGFLAMIGSMIEEWASVGLPFMFTTLLFALSRWPRPRSTRDWEQTARSTRPGSN
jgi:hypothetical protein